MTVLPAGPAADTRGWPRRERTSNGPCGRRAKGSGVFPR